MKDLYVCLLCVLCYVLLGVTNINYIIFLHATN